MIYFDHNATTPIDDRVLEAMLPFLSGFYGNPSALYKLGRVAHSAIDGAREQVAALVGVNAAQVIFTSGGTEANNLALQSTSLNNQLAISAIEHPSISDTALSLTPSHKIIAVDPNGLISPETIDALDLKPKSIVSMMLANNETGVIQNIADFSDKLNERGIIVHSDAVQAAGKIPVSFNQLGVQRLSLSSHKLYGAKGCGALIVERNAQIKPLISGGGQERGLRSGTENVAAIVGFGKAAELALAELNDRTKKLLSLRQHLENELIKIPNLTIFSQNVARLPNTVQFSIAGIDGEMLLMQLDQKNIAVSSGSACAAAGGKPSPVLTAMGVKPALAKGAIRISLGKDNNLNEINTFITTLNSLITHYGNHIN
ncbi:MAG: aminotransferase class V-fold PLP-dependent enzyme [Methylococcaceae bacterium]|nr:aminotransferase class V-fold PLP-dependent enzyme [Methylococcaceae bacterium]